MEGAPESQSPTQSPCATDPLELALGLACADNSPTTAHAWTPVRERGGDSLELTPGVSAGDDSLEQALNFACGDNDSPWGTPTLLGPLRDGVSALGAHPLACDTDSLEHALSLASSPLRNPIDTEDTQEATKYFFVEDTLPLIIIAKQMIANLCTHDADHVRVQLGKIARFITDSCTTGFLITTACSGTDLMSSILTIFFEACASALCSAFF